MALKIACFLKNRPATGREAPVCATFELHEFTRTRLPI